MGPTVQQTLREAMRAAGLERNPVATGRTDAGVHARMQVLSFKLLGEGAIDEVPARINAHLPNTLGIALARAAPPHFNAHWKASAKEYRYRLLLADDPRWSRDAWRVRFDVATLRETLALAVGTHDFFAFHDKSSVIRPRTVLSLEVVESPAGLVDVRLRGDGFGRYMVRYLIGGGVAVASGGWSRDAFAETLSRGATTIRPEVLERAPAAGLVLWNVEYPPADDPFTSEERLASAGVPREPPFCAA